MHYVFTKADLPTLQHWREFALRHLQTADHNTRNLYDIRLIADLSVNTGKWMRAMSERPRPQQPR